MAIPFETGLVRVLHEWLITASTHTHNNLVAYYPKKPAQ